MFYKNLTVVDFAYFTEAEGLRGESLICNVELVGEVPKDGMILDFGKAKKIIKSVIDQKVDHTVVLNSRFARLNGDGTATVDTPTHAYTAPCPAFCFLDTDYSVGALEAHIQKVIREALREDSKVSEVSVALLAEPLPQGKTSFQYTHGLKFHDGNCQRIWHGHRNTVDVFINGQQDYELEHKLVATILKGSVHFAEKSVFRSVGEDYMVGQVEYTSSQGKFHSRLPIQEIIVMDCEPSIENIASFLLGCVVKMGASGLIEVVAYEGIGKGAIARTRI
jgi:6-pyruvoyl-tetrahydropterin synthase